MKIVITGATGFIGHHLLEALGKTEHRLCVITRKKNDFPAGIEIVQGDISDKSSIACAFAGADVLIHMAAEIRDETKFESANITAVKHLCELANAHHLKKVVHLSSVGVQGVQFSLKPQLVHENHPCDPKNGYEKSKLESEKIWLTQLDPTVSLTVLRPTNVFGEHHPRKALLNLMEKANKEQTFYIDRNAMVNYLYVKDLVEAIVYFAQDHKKETDNIYNVGNAVKLSDFLRTISEGLQRKSSIRYVPQWIYYPAGAAAGLFFKNRIGQLKSLFNKVVYDDTKLVAKLPYRYGPLTGVKNTIAYYKQNALLKND